MIELKNATSEAVRYACMNFHYAHAVPVVKWAYNVYNEKKEWCGVIIYGFGANNHIATAVGYKTGEVCELVRVALNGKQPCTSECVAASLKKLHKDSPQIKMVVSYADLDQDHAGTIYQATNWIYLGKYNAGSCGAYIVNGKKMHPKSCYSKGWKQNVEWLKKNVDSNARAFYTKGKHKYIFVFDKKQRKKWLEKAQPYPKKMSVLIKQENTSNETSL